LAKCTSCGAPLPPSGIICEYCGTRNDIDLREKGSSFIDIRPNQERICPVCHIKLQTIDVGEAVPFLIERCETCFGIFFDLHELEEMIDRSVKGSRNVNLERLSQITENPRHIDIIVYRKCPVCRKAMQRKNFMKRSGVITDVCAEHGIWLDSGELRQIFEWVKSGGIERAEQQETTRQQPLPGENSHDMIERTRREYRRDQTRRHRKGRKEEPDGSHGVSDLLDLFSDWFGASGR
jgi:Zn-finger nucleic acid-binding protein